MTPEQKVTATRGAFTLVTVASGATSLRSEEHCETFHPVIGPMAEARGLHIAGSRIIERAGECARPFVIWDIGLGAGANAIAVLEALAEAKCPARVELHSFDCTAEPLEFALQHAAELGYLAPWREPVESLLKTDRAVAGKVAWHFHRGDFRDFVRKSRASVIEGCAPVCDSRGGGGEIRAEQSELNAATWKSPLPCAPDAILYDPYSPESNPGMWTLEHFTRLRACLDPARPCTLTSYSRSTSVRVTLMLAGFFVGYGGGTGEKDQTTLAATHRDMLAHPLDAEWLGRVSRSTRGAPLREHPCPGRISADDLAALRAKFQSPEFQAPAPKFSELRNQNLELGIPN